MEIIRTIRWEDAVGLLKRTAVKLAVRDEAREHWGPSQVTDTSQKVQTVITGAAFGLGACIPRTSLDIRAVQRTPTRFWPGGAGPPMGVPCGMPRRASGAAFPLPPSGQKLV